MTDPIFKKTRNNGHKPNVVEDGSMIAAPLCTTYAKRGTRNNRHSDERLDLFFLMFENHRPSPVMLPIPKIIRIGLMPRMLRSKPPAPTTTKYFVLRAERPRFHSACRIIAMTTGLTP